MSYLAPTLVLPVVATSFVPARVVVGSRLVPSTSFVPAIRGHITAMSAADPRGLVVMVSGMAHRCLWSALGGRDSVDAIALVDACRAARRSGDMVQLWVAPGKSGTPSRGYFCAIQASN